MEIRREGGKKRRSEERGQKSRRSEEKEVRRNKGQ